MPLSEQEVLHMPFSIKRHKETFSHYLEAIIRPDGTVEYAMPSHTEKLLSIIMEKHNITREEALALCPLLAPVAQLVERQVEALRCGGSTPSWRTI